MTPTLTHKKKFRWAIALGIATVIIVLSVSAPLPSTGSIEGSDKVGHFLAYAALSLALCRALKSPKSPQIKWVALAGAVVIASSLGAGMEGLQSRIPERMASGYDMVANFSGALVAALVYRWAVSRLKVLA